MKKEESAAEWVSIEVLTPWRDNPRQNDGEAVDAVAASIKRFGFASPIIARMDGEVIAGHTRLKAAQALGLDRVPVRYMDLDPADAKLLALADNRVGEIADWDDDKLADLFMSMHAEAVDLRGIGWSDDELEAIINPKSEDDIGLYVDEDLNFSVVITCSDEEQQVELLKRFESEGLICQALIS